MNVEQIMEQNLKFIGIKKLRVFPIFFFLKRRQIKFFKLLYIKKKFRSGWPWDHPSLKVAPPLTNTANYVNNCEKSGEKNTISLVIFLKKKVIVY